MRVPFIFAAIGLATMLAGLANAQEAGNKDNGDWFQKTAHLGPGVYRIDKSDTGRVTSLVIVGQVRIRSDLDASKAIETARADATASASAEFVRWLKDGASVRVASDGKTVDSFQGDEGTDPKLPGRRLNPDSPSMTALGRELVGHLQTLYTEQNKDLSAFVVILGWKTDTPDGAEKITTSIAPADLMTPKQEYLTALDHLADDCRTAYAELEAGFEEDHDETDFKMAVIDMKKRGQASFDGIAAAMKADPQLSPAERQDLAGAIDARRQEYMDFLANSVRQHEHGQPAEESK